MSGVQPDLQKVAKETKKSGDALQRKLVFALLLGPIDINGAYLAI